MPRFTLSQMLMASRLDLCRLAILKAPSDEGRSLRQMRFKQHAFSTGSYLQSSSRRWN